VDGERAEEIREVRARAEEERKHRAAAEDQITELKKQLAAKTSASGGGPAGGNLKERDRQVFALKRQLEDVAAEAKAQKTARLRAEKMVADMCSQLEEKQEENRRLEERLESADVEQAERIKARVNQAKESWLENVRVAMEAYLQRNCKPKNK